MYVRPQQFIPESDIPHSDLAATVLDSFSRKFDIEDVVQLVQLESESMHVLELFHGPTLAFKDLVGLIDSREYNTVFM